MFLDTPKAVSRNPRLEKWNAGAEKEMGSLNSLFLGCFWSLNQLCQSLLSV